MDEARFQDVTWMKQWAHDYAEKLCACDDMEMTEEVRLQIEYMAADVAKLFAKYSNLYIGLVKKIAEYESMLKDAEK